VTRGRRLLIGGIGVIVIGVVVAEEGARRATQRRYREAVASRRQLELQFGEVLATHGQLKERLANEQQRSQALSDELLAMRGRLEETVGQLSEETRMVRQLQMRIASMQQHMDQLQGELALSLRAPPSRTSGQGGGQVQLERIVVSRPGVSGLTGRVVSVHQDWNFVVIDLGWNDVKIGDAVSIFRNEQLLAQARIERVQEAVCAATILPEWKATAVQVNDVARIL